MKSKPRLVKLRITDLILHPLNANRLKEDHQVKLQAHIAASGNYPPLIVHEHPAHKGKWEIIDGAHRWAALKALDHKLVQCQIWDVDESETLILLATLNRLTGQDDPQLRGTLLDNLTQQFEISHLAEQLPIDAAAIQKYIDAAKAPPAPNPPKPLDTQIVAVTFFIPYARKAKLLAALATFSKDRGLAVETAVSMAAAYRTQMTDEPPVTTPDRTSAPCVPSS